MTVQFQGVTVIRNLSQNQQGASEKLSSVLRRPMSLHLKDQANDAIYNLDGQDTAEFAKSLGVYAIDPVIFEKTDEEISMNPWLNLVTQKFLDDISGTTESLGERVRAYITDLINAGGKTADGQDIQDVNAATITAKPQGADAFADMIARLQAGMAGLDPEAALAEAEEAPAGTPAASSVEDKKAPSAEDAQAAQDTAAPKAATTDTTGETQPSRIRKVSHAEFEKEVLDASDHQPVLVNFYADWAEPCKTLAPLLEELAEKPEYQNVKIVKVDVDENPELVDQCGIQSIPALRLIRNGELAMGINGMPDQEQLKGLLDSGLKLG